MAVNLFNILNKSKKADAGTAGAQPEAANAVSPEVAKFSTGLVSVLDIIAPEAIEVDFTFQRINSTYTRTLFISGYPRSVPANWLSPLINFPHSLDIAMYIYPVDVGKILNDLRRKITEMEAELASDIKQGKISNIDTEIKLEDARVIQEQLAKGAERFYQFGLYITISASTTEELNRVTKQVQSTLGSLLIVSKNTTLQMEEGFKTTLPTGVDKLQFTRNMDTTSLATTFPFTSSELTSETGIVYGINEHNESLVIFDRFQMENANMVVFAKSGAGKSFAIKLEAYRHLMFDTEVIILDPEREYEEMCKAVGGEYVAFGFNSNIKFNPFDLSAVYEEGQNELGLKIISLHSLLRVMMGEFSPTEDAVIDRAIVAAYKAKGITPDPATQSNEPPLLEDLYKALIGMESTESANLAARLEKYVKGSFRGIFDQRSNFDLTNRFTVFSVKELEEQLRPIAMFIILDYVWTRVKRDLKRRLLIVDEAWYFMKHGDSASFLHSMAKRARKYYLGITTITQDVEDFLNSEWGKAIVTNSSLQLLMKQSSAAVPRLGDVFFLSEGEKRLLLSADVGEGLFFAGQNHVAIRVIASEPEYSLITTNPAEIMAKKKADQAAIDAKAKSPVAPPPPTRPAYMEPPKPQTQATTVSPAQPAPPLQENVGGLTPPTPPPVK